VLLYAGSVFCDMKKDEAMGMFSSHLICGFISWGNDVHRFIFGMPYAVQALLLLVQFAGIIAQQAMFTCPYRH
jgi:hypothetical protein